MKFKKVFISNLDVVQLANVASISHSNIMPNKEHFNDLDLNQDPKQIKIFEDIMRIILETTHSQNNVKNLLSTKIDKKTNNLKLNFTTKVIDNIEAKNADLNLKSFSSDIDLLNRYNSKLVKYTKSSTIKNTIKKPKENKTPKQLLTSYNTYINEDPGTSKVLNQLFEQFQKTNQESSKLYDELLEAEEIASKYQIAIVSLNAASVLFDIIGFVHKGIGLLSIPTGIISNILSHIKDGFNTKIELLRKSLNLAVHLYQTNPNGSNIDKIKIIIDLINTFIPEIKTNSMFWNKALASVSKKWSIFGFFYDLHSLIESGVQLDKELKSLERTRELVTNLKNIYEQNKNRWTEFQKLNKIVVISETRQTGSYSNGGTGGTNIFFKRLIDGKIFSRKEMLEMSKFELASYNLIKVKRTVTKNNKTYTYEYLRSKNSNKTLEDNLG